MVNHEFGILLQGRVSSWTRDIIKEYKTNFPDAQIVFSTWDDENVSGINCKTIQIKKPIPTKPHDSNINLQIIGSQKGLEHIDAENILKCRSDIFIHNKKIFEIFKEKCPSEKIMTVNWNTFDFDYRISDFCLLATKSVMKKFWNEMPLYDGSYAIAPESYFGEMYTTKILDDHKPWKNIINKYFLIMDYHLDFQIEWEKVSTFEKAAEWYENARDVYKKWSS
tara:strand:+ start:368 stop:1036 length:669 start_codon:yes stop_codon:yes gene_type:complete